MGGDPGSDGLAGGPSGVGEVRGATSAATAFLGDGEWSGVRPHYGGGPEASQGRPERLRRLLLPEAASVASAGAQSLAAGKSAAEVAEPGLGTGGLAPGAAGLRAWEAAERLLLLDLLVQEAAVSTPPVPSLSPGKGGVTSRRSAASAPQSHLGWVPGDDLGPPRVLRGSRKCVGNPGQPLRLLSLHLLLRPSSPLPAVTLHYRPKCLCLDSQVLFVYLSLVVVVFLLRARGGQFNLLDKVFRFHAWH